MPDAALREETVGAVDGARMPAPGEIYCWLFALDEGPSDAALLDAEERARAAAFRFDEDRARFVAGHAQIRRILGACLGQSPARLPIARSGDGRPYVENGRGLNFNYSHTEGWGLLALALTPVLGADIETVRDTGDLDAVAREHFSPAEQSALAALAPEARADGFYACWTRKEAVVKALGRGLATSLSLFDVSLDPAAPAQILRAEGEAAAAARWSLSAFQPNKDCWAAVASDLAAPQLHLYRLAA